MFCPFHQNWVIKEVNIFIKCASVAMNGALPEQHF